MNRYRFTKEFEALDDIEARNWPAYRDLSDVIIERAETRTIWRPLDHEPVQEDQGRSTNGAERLRGLLESLEWIHPYWLDNRGFCPSCFQNESRGHVSSCALVRELKERRVQLP